jgi:homoserine dehydrogenase
MKIGLLGFGTVGRATVEVLSSNANEIRRRTGIELKLAAVATRTPAKAVGILPAGCKLSSDILSVTQDPEIDVVVELMGGVDAAKSAVLSAIEGKKHVVTANKALLAMHGNEIFARARDQHVMVAYEAAVSVAIPIIKTLRESLAANRIESVIGIVNGTSNFILTEMREHGKPYNAALADAQQRGYAEADPSFDVNGDDAAHKITILAANAFGMPMRFDAAHIEGISKINIIDVESAETMGYRIKLLAIARKYENGIECGVELCVRPILIRRDHMMAGVNGVMNAIMVKGNVSGTTLHYGAGAGGLPTSSAVIADLIDVARLCSADARHYVPLAAFQPDQLIEPKILSQDTLSRPYYLRIRVADELGVLAAITRALAEHSISVDVMRQEEPQNQHTDLVIITHVVAAKDIQAALAQIREIPAVQADIVVLRVEPLE